MRPAGGMRFWCGVGVVGDDVVMATTRQPYARCSIVPPYLLQQLGYAETLQLDDRIRALRRERVGGVRGAGGAGPASRAAWTVHDAGGSTDLPGRTVRSAGEPESGDAAVDEAAAGITGALALFREVYERDSYDGRGALVSLTVHYGRDYANAFWDGTQLVFGDGDGEVFGRFTRAADVLAHELAHAVTERTAGLVYQGQPGALNESVSDVFAACSEQRLLGQQATEADWLIGTELFLPGVRARALRDMAAPGTAYDDPRLGRDPQPAHLDDYVDTTDDNGGVHLNSGIPNRAFHLAAVAIGGSSWAGAGRIWYDALVGGDVRPDTDFAGFAAATVRAAGPRAAEVEEAWRQVGVRPVRGSSASATGGAAPGGPPRTVRVRRSGGFVGRTVEAEVDLGAGDERAARLTGLVDRIDPAATAGSPGAPLPDHYTYEFDLDGQRVRVPEQDLTDDLRAVADLVLRPGGPVDS